MRYPNVLSKSSLLARSALCVVILVLLYSPVHAASISARLHQDSERAISIQVQVGKVAPSTLIVQVSIPGTNEITHATPRIAKVGKNRNTAKWLLRDVKPGTISITVHTSKPIRVGAVSATVSYRDKNSGAIRKLNVSSK